MFLGLTGQGQDLGSEPDQDSLNYYLEIVDQGEKQVGGALARIGFLYKEAGRYNSALSYFERALPLLNGESQTEAMAWIYLARGEIYEIFGDNAEPRRYYRLSESQFNRALEIFRQTDNRGGALQLYKNLATISAKRRNFASALSYQNQVIQSLSQLYQDSLQQQAESFNDLLNKEIQSSKDTIFIDKPVAIQGEKELTLWNWRHIALVVLAIGLVLAISRWLVLSRETSELQTQITLEKTSKKQLLREAEELQKMNLTLSQTEKEQRHLNQTKDKIFSIISHDLRSPINTISGFLNILGVKLKSIGDIELKALAKEMEESTGRLSDFLDDLLKWSMSQMGQLKAQPERINLSDLLQKNYLLVESRLKSKNIHFKTDIQEHIPVYADVNMVNLVLRNLISNAIKFTRQGGYIVVGLSSYDQDRAKLTVVDDGIGISESDLKNLFEFKGSHINGTPENRGAGLGLILCKDFIEMNGGQIFAESQLGKGTRFTILLPSKPPQVKA